MKGLAMGWSLILSEYAFDSEVLMMIRPLLVNSLSFVRAVIRRVWIVLVTLLVTTFALMLPLIRRRRRLVDIRETAIPLRSQIRNSGFDFSEMTTSVVAVITDVMRNGKPVTGFAFNSTGRYACGAAMLVPLCWRPRWSSFDRLFGLGSPHCRANYTTKRYGRKG
jgi:hypothetical protein